jgi:hypothetical protein
MCESGFTTLFYRRERQIANSALRMINNHQICKLIEDRPRYDSYSAKPLSTKSFYIRAQDVCGRFNIDLYIEDLDSQNPP